MEVEQRDNSVILRKETCQEFIANSWQRKEEERAIEGSAEDHSLLIETQELARVSCCVGPEKPGPAS